MTVAIVGAGAMGGLWAVRLARAGTDICVVDVSDAVIAAIKAEGLSLRTGGASLPGHASGPAGEVVWPRATAQPAEIGPVDAVFFFVKAQHTASAAQLARPLVDGSTTVASLQNGWGNADVLAGVFPPEQLVVGVTYHSATVLAPGRVAHTGQGTTFLGPYADGAPLDRATAIGALLSGAGIDTTVTPGVKTEVWKKLILNAATLPTAALTRLRAGELGQPGPLLDLVDAVAAEAVEVARARGYEIDRAERFARIHAVLAGAGAGKPSMLQDVEAGRKTEIEVINGAIVRAAAELGIDTPLNRAMVALIGGVERAWQQ